MRVLLVSDSVHPISKGTSANLAASLPRAMRALGYEVTVCVPMHSDIDATKHSLARKLNTVDVTVSGRDYACEIYSGRTTTGVDVVLVAHATLFDGGEGNPDYETAGHVMREVVHELYADHPFDLVHGCGRFGATFSRHEDKARVVSLHGLQSENVAVDALNEERFLVFECESGPLSDDHGFSIFRSGIGIDAARWNPVTDAALTSRFDPHDDGGKSRCKSAIQSSLGLEVNPALPLIAIFVNDETASMLEDVIRDVIHSNAQIVLWANESQLSPSLGALGARWADAFGRVDANEANLRSLLGASDFLLVPPSGDGFESELACIAHRYGVLPLVGRHARAACAVVDTDSELVTGSGFLYEQWRSDDVVATLRRAVVSYLDPNGIRKLRRRAMQLDHSWDRIARLYGQVYRRAARSLYGEQGAEWTGEITSTSV